MPPSFLFANATPESLRPPVGSRPERRHAAAPPPQDTAGRRLRGLRAASLESKMPSSYSTMKGPATID